MRSVVNMGSEGVLRQHRINTMLRGLDGMLPKGRTLPSGVLGLYQGQMSQYACYDRLDIYINPDRGLTFRVDAAKIGEQGIDPHIELMREIAKQTGAQVLHLTTDRVSLEDGTVQTKVVAARTFLNIQESSQVPTAQG